jgi:hypothetical protein
MADNESLCFPVDIHKIAEELNQIACVIRNSRPPELVYSYYQHLVPTENYSILLEDKNVFNQVKNLLQMKNITLGKAAFRTIGGLPIDGTQLTFELLFQ